MELKNNSYNVNPNESPLEALRRMREQSAGIGVSREPETEIKENDVQKLKSNTTSGNKVDSSKKGDLISKIEFIVFLMSLVVLPSFIIPLPWGWSEFGKGVMMLIFAVVLFTLEIMRIFLRGKLSFVKSFLDIAILVVTGSYVLSTIFSRDISTSLWGFDYRLGSGFVVFLTIVIFFYLIRSVVNSDDRLSKTLIVGSLGVSLSSLLSVLTFFGVNLFKIFPTIDRLFIKGFPLLTSNHVGIVFWGFGLLLAILYILKKKEDSVIVNGLLFMFSLFNVVAIVLFSLHGGFFLSLLIIISLLVIFFYVLSNKAEFEGSQSIYVLLLLLLITVPTIIFRFDSVRESVIKSTGAVNQINIPGQITWSIATNTLSNSIATGLVGFGTDTFSIYFNLKKPAFVDNMDLTSTSFTYGSSEILTLMGNRGIIGALIWLVMGVIVVIQLIKDFGNKEKDSYDKTLLVTADVIILFIFASSFLIFYSFILIFALIFAFTLRIVLEAILDPRNAENIVVRIDLLEEKMGQRKDNTVAIIASVVTIFIGGLALASIASMVSASSKVLKAENKIVIFSEELNTALEEEKDLEFDTKDKSFSEIINLYSEAISQQQNNSLYRRRKTVLLIDYMNLYVQQINKVSEELKEKDKKVDLEKDEKIIALQNSLNQIIEIALEEAEVATKNGKNVFDNWDVRGYLYSQLLNLNLTNYADSGIAALNNAVSLNPVSYISYYRGAQMLIAKEDLEGASTAISTSLQINPNYIPSLVLGAELSVANKDNQTAINLLTRAKEILEELELTDNETYKSIEERIKEIKDGGEAVDENLEEIPPMDDIPTETEETTLLDSAPETTEE